MLLQYQLFYKQFGIRRPQQMLSPRVFTLDMLHFPRNSVYHFVSHNHDVVDPDDTVSYLSGYTSKKIIIDYVMQLTHTDGMPRHRQTPILTMIKPFLNHHKNFKYIKDAATRMKDPFSLIVMNYAYMNKVYKYINNPMSSYYEWRNMEATMWNKIIETSRQCDRDQFIFYEMPDVLPSISTLKIFTLKTNKTLIKVLDTPGKLFMLEMWKWLDEHHRQDSLLATIPQETLNKINIVFIHNGKWITINLDYLDQWREESNREKINGVQSFKAIMLQKFFLKTLIQLTSKSTVLQEDIQDKEDGNSDVVDQEVKQDEVEVAEGETPSKKSDDVTDNYEDDIDEDMGIDTNYDSEANIYIAGLNKEISKAKTDPTSKDVINDITDSDLVKQVGVSQANLNDQAVLDKILDDLEDELNSLEYIENKNLQQKDIKLDKHGEEITKEVVNNKTTAEVTKEVFTPLSNEEKLNKHLETYADYGILSASEYKSIKKSIAKLDTMPNPYNDKVLLKDSQVVPKQDTLISKDTTKLIDASALEDKSMDFSSLKVFDKQYLDKVLKTDILSSVSHMQNAGVIIEDYNIEHDHSILGDFEYHTLKLRPIDGKSSTVRFKIPKINEDSTMVSNSNKYIMRKQRVDLPIRKIKPTIVGLTSYYGKTFVQRSEYSRNDPVAWIYKQLNKIFYSHENKFIENIYPSDVYDNYFKAPYIYNALAHKYKAIITKEVELVFDHKWRDNNIEASELKNIETDKYIVCGKTVKGQEYIVVDFDNKFYRYTGKEYVPIGNIYDLLHLEEDSSPVDFASIRIFSKTIPIAIVMGYLIGLDNLLKLIDAKYEVLESKVIKSNILGNNRFAVRFKDKILIFNKGDKLDSLVFGGLHAYGKLLKGYDLAEFNSKGVYMNLLEAQGMGSIYLKEIDSSNDLFVDPITKEILEDMHMPLTYQGLLIKACEMLEDYNTPDFQDMHYMRIRGYERIAGAIYKELAHAVRNYKVKNIRGKSQIELNPYAVWKTIAQDPSVKLVEDINPIQNLKESESVTYTGEGGRNKDTLVKSTRGYHASDMGVVSEATSDSGDVGVNFYLSANPDFKNIRGLTNAVNNKANSNILSTSALLSPGSDHDSPQRVNFVSIQQSHSIAFDGSHQPYVQTGYESVIAKRTSDLFAYHAEDDGKVISLNELGIIVQYKTKGTRGVHLGRSYGKAEGSVYPHDIVTPLKLNETFKKEDVIAYNEGFFEPDFYDPKNIIMKTGMTVKTALFETNQTLEDSSSISKEVSDKMSSKTTKIKSYIIEFKQSIHDILKPGTIVGPNSTLFIIADETTSNTDIFTEETLDVLKKISSHAPRAKVKGTIDRIEVYYHGDKEDMSPSLRKLANISDKFLKDQAIATNNTVVTGQVNTDYRVEGNPLLLDTAEIKIYITINTKAGIGDKGVFANQMKSVFGETMEYPVHTESGEKVDALFGYRSIAARIVISPLVIGTTATLLKTIAKKAIAIFEGK